MPDHAYIRDRIPQREPVAIIAIGASAGGIQAIRAVLEPLRTDLTCPVVIVLHLAPQYDSHAAEVLARTTHLTVQQARHNDLLQPGVVYIAPPDFHLNVNHGAVRLTHSPAINFSRPSIDSMFRSIAIHYGKRAIAVVLTGSGADGAEGMRAIKAAGGFNIVQDPHTAQFSSMPDAAVATLCADRVLPLGDIGPFLSARCGPVHS